MIWDLIEESTFDKYFSDPDTTITKLLLDENIITQLKNQNPKLLYLANHKHEFMVELIDYVITMPNAGDGEDRCHKLPYISSQLLAIDSDLIYQQFFREGTEESENEYWVKLLSFLESSAAQNEVLIGYFQKVVNNLYAGNKIKTTKVVCCHLNRFTALLPNGSVVDILKKCLVLLNTPEGAVLSQRKLILTKIIQLFASSDQSIKSSCSQILCEVIAKFQAFSSGDVLLEQLLSSQRLKEIYNCKGSVSVNEFLTALIKKSQQRTLNEHDQSVPLFTLSAQHREKIRGYVQRETESIREIAKSTGFIINQNRQTVRKSNKSIYSLLDLIRVVLDDGVNCFIDEGLLSFLWNMVLLYPYNNILQVLILKIFTSTLSSSNQQVRKTFLETYQIHLVSLSKHHLSLLKQFIFTIWKETKQYSQTKAETVEFKELVATHLQPLLKYQVVNHQKVHKPQQKLIVDEEDKTNAAPKQNQIYQQQNTWKDHETQKEEKQQKHELFQQFGKVNSNSVEQKQQNEVTKKQSEADADFFNEWNLENLEKSFQGKPQNKPKTDMFNDFTSFF